MVLFAVQILIVDLHLDGLLGGRLAVLNTFPLQVVRSFVRYKLVRLKDLFTFSYLLAYMFDTFSVKLKIFPLTHRATWGGRVWEFNSRVRGYSTDVDVQNSNSLS